MIVVIRLFIKKNNKINETIQRRNDDSHSTFLVRLNEVSEGVRTPGPAKFQLCPRELPLQGKVRHALYVRSRTR